MIWIWHYFYYYNFKYRSTANILLIYWKNIYFYELIGWQNKHAKNPCHTRDTRIDIKNFHRKKKHWIEKCDRKTKKNSCNMFGHYWRIVSNIAIIFFSPSYRVYIYWILGDPIMANTNVVDKQPGVYYITGSWPKKIATIDSRSIYWQSKMKKGVWNIEI